MLTKNDLFEVQQKQRIKYNRLLFLIFLKSVGDKKSIQTFEMYDPTVRFRVGHRPTEPATTLWFKSSPLTSPATRNSLLGTIYAGFW